MNKQEKLVLFICPWCGLRQLLDLDEIISYPFRCACCNSGFNTSDEL